MTRDEKMQIAWIALDGLLLRNFFSDEAYESPQYDKALSDAFCGYHRYLAGEDTTEYDFHMLMHMQNLAENDLKNGDPRLKAMEPAELVWDIADRASESIIHGQTFSIFTSSASAVEDYDQCDRRAGLEDDVGKIAPY